MKRITLFFATFLVAALCLGKGAAEATVITKTLTIGSGNGSASSTVSLPITVDDPTGVGGAAFTIQYDPKIFTFAGLEPAAKPINDGSGCLVPNSDPPDYSNCSAQTIGNTLFYQYNEVKDQNNPTGIVLVAAASAQELTQTTLLRAKFTIQGGSGSYPIKLLRSIIKNEAAGYPVGTLLPVLVGMPATTPNQQGYYPTPEFATTLKEGTITVIAPGYRISGSVKYQGGPADGTDANGSTVALERKIGTTSTYAFQDQTTVQNGSYAFANRVAGDYRLVVTPANPAYYKNTETLTVSGDTTKAITLVTATKYSGTVTINGNKVCGVRIRVTDSTNKIIGLYPVDCATGKFETPPLAPDVQYTFSAVYGNESTSITPGTTNNWTLTLRIISGTLNGITTGKVRIEAASASKGLIMGTDITVSADGTAYSIANLLPSTDYIVSAASVNQPVQYYDGKSRITEANAVNISNVDQANINFNFASTDKATIKGRVMKDGQSVAAKSVYAFEVATYAMQSAVSNANGEYTLTVAPGTYELFTTHDGKVFYYNATKTTLKSSEATRLTAANGQELTGKDFDLTLCAYAVKGSVFYERESGAPVAGALISVSGNSGQGNALTSVTGAYSIGGLCNGAYTVRMDPLRNNYPIQKSSATIADKDTTGVNFIVDSGSTLSGRVTDNGSGTPIAKAMVYLVDGTTGTLFGGRMYTTDANGEYAIRDIPSGLYSLNVSHPEYKPKNISPLSITQDTTQNVTLLKGDYIYGTVTDGSNNPMAGVMIIAAGNTSTPGITDRNGNYAIYGLDSQTPYVLIASKRGYERSVNIGVIPASGGTQVNFIMTAITETFTMAGTVKSTCEGSPSIANARVIASYSPGGGQADFFKVGATDANGNYSLSGLPANSNYTLIVVPGGNLPVYKKSGINGTSGTVTEDVTIPCGSTISGAITLTTPADTVYVVLFDANGKYVDYATLTQSNQDGKYEYTFEGLVDTVEYKVVAIAAGNVTTWHDGKDTLGTAKSVSAGTTNVDITLLAQ